MNEEMKKHYLVPALNWKNIVGDRITSIEIEENKIIVKFCIYPDIERPFLTVQVTIVYNLKNNKLSCKATGIGSRKYNYTAKRVAIDIFKTCEQLAINNYNNDCSDSLNEAVFYYYYKLKELTNDTAVFNQFNVDCMHLKTVKEIEIAYLIVKDQLEKSNKNEDYGASYIIGNRNFIHYSNALQYCNECDFDHNMIEVEK